MHQNLKKNTNHQEGIKYKHILDNLEQTMDIKEKFIQHCYIGTNLKKKVGLYRIYAL